MDAALCCAPMDERPAASPGSGYPLIVIGMHRSGTSLLTDLLDRGGRLVFTHDPKVAMARVARDERGRFFAAEATPTLDAVAA